MTERCRNKYIRTVGRFSVKDFYSKTDIKYHVYSTDQEKILSVVFKGLPRLDKTKFSESLRDTT